MNSLGDNHYHHPNVEVKKRQETDGSWVVCANQHTEFQRTSSNEQQMFRCELTVDDVPYSSLTSVIKVKGNLILINIFKRK